MRRAGAHVDGPASHGQESEPTLCRRDRTKDAPTYHIDYVFLPAGWIGKVRQLSIGSFETRCGAGLSDHVPVVVEVDV
jgi:endonuclease/exonuclease/phosphatase family metal-dependent hydrolase